MEIQTLSGQSLFDIAIQFAGDASAAFDIAIANGRNFSGRLPAGSTMTIPAIVNGRVVDFYSSRNIYPATGIAGQAIGIFDRIFDHKFK